MNTDTRPADSPFPVVMAPEDWERMHRTSAQLTRDALNALLSPPSYRPARSPFTPRKSTR